MIWCHYALAKLTNTAQTLFWLSWIFLMEIILHKLDNMLSFWILTQGTVRQHCSSSCETKWYSYPLYLTLSNMLLFNHNNLLKPCIHLLIFTFTTISNLLYHMLSLKFFKWSLKWALLLILLLQIFPVAKNFNI